MYNTKDAKSAGEFRGLILVTTVWLKVLVDFHFCYMYLCYFEHRKMLRIQHLPKLEWLTNELQLFTARL